MNWIHHCTKNESSEFAAQIMGIGYIPWAPHGGRHTMNDFGELQKTLPQDFYSDERDHYTWGFFKDDQYSYH